ncbi:MAG: hypothetical protein QM345_06115 [Bacillota bacterium]|jgi:hypothetical protein|nr:hypothetical protein [Bacillota bacterium]
MMIVILNNVKPGFSFNPYSQREVIKLQKITRPVPEVFSVLPSDC